MFRFPNLDQDYSRQSNSNLLCFLLKQCQFFLHGKPLRHLFPCFTWVLCVLYFLNFHTSLSVVYLRFLYNLVCNDHQFEALVNHEMNFLEISLPIGVGIVLFFKKKKLFVLTILML